MSGAGFVEVRIRRLILAILILLDAQGCKMGRLVLGSKVEFSYLD